MTFGRPTPSELRAKSDARKAANMAGLMVPARTVARGVLARCLNTVLAAPKDPEPIRSEPYRRLVAALPCSACRIEGFGQAAHPPPKAKGKKECDLDIFSLCCARPGVPGCHYLFDTMQLIPRAAMRYEAEKWARQTRARIKADGNWPAGLHYPDGAPE